MSEVMTVQTDELKLTGTKSYIGFWLYLMTDCILFASLFATYVVLRNNTYGGPTSQSLFDTNFVLIETLLLLTSSFICGLTVLAASAKRKELVLIGLFITFLLGAGFLGMELTEFSHLVADGNSWQRSGFLSAFFTLVGTHGLHIATGLLWVLVLGMQIIRQGLGKNSVKRLTLFSLFWHFLDVVWIFIFTIVYLLGAI